MKNNTLSIASVIAPSSVLAAYRWLCRRRRHFPPDADIWHFRIHAHTLIPTLLDQLRHGTYTFQPVQLIEKTDGQTIAVWSSADALVIKLLADALRLILPVHPCCEHVAGHGGGKTSAQKLDRQIRSGQFHFVLRTDIQGYYAQINKHTLLAQLAVYIDCPILMNLLGQFLFYSVERGGVFHTPKLGISRGSALSPLLAAFHLYALDKEFADRQGSDWSYARYMDDFVILTRTRWQLRRAVRRLKQWFQHFGFRFHPEKTYIGKIDRLDKQAKLDWMGYAFNGKGLCGIAPRALNNHLDTQRRLYEQARKKGHPWDTLLTRVRQYQKRWIHAFQFTVLYTPLRYGCFFRC